MTRPWIPISVWLLFALAWSHRQTKGTLAPVGTTHCRCSGNPGSSFPMLCFLQMLAVRMAALPAKNCRCLWVALQNMFIMKIVKVVMCMCKKYRYKYIHLYIMFPSIRLLEVGIDKLEDQMQTPWTASHIQPQFVLITICGTLSQEKLGLPQFHDIWMVCCLCTKNHGRITGFAQSSCPLGLFWQFPPSGRLLRGSQCWASWQGQGLEEYTTALQFT